jgi:hypothetical protein
MDRDAVRRWLSGHRSAERRALELMKQEGPMASERSFEAAMELCDLAVVPEHDLVRDREIAEARALWARLKKPWVAKLA